MIFTVLPAVVIFVLLYLVIKWAVSSALRDIPSTFRDTFTGSPCVREILDQRYARSEIEREEYEQMRRDLQAELATPNVRGPERQR